MSNHIYYILSPVISAHELRTLFKASGIRRPADDLPRLKEMLQHSNLIIGAYLGDQLVGIARGLTDYSYCCYLSDLAVVKEHQHHGVGSELLERVKSTIGPRCTLILLSAPEAMGYYPKAGFERAENAWLIKRGL